MAPGVDLITPAHLPEINCDFWSCKFLLPAEARPPQQGWGGAFPVLHHEPAAFSKSNVALQRCESSSPALFSQIFSAQIRAAVFLFAPDRHNMTHPAHPMITRPGLLGTVNKINSLQPDSQDSHCSEGGVGLTEAPQSLFLRIITLPGHLGATAPKGLRPHWGCGECRWWWWGY